MSKETKTWSIWVDGFEMNVHKLDYEGAVKMKKELMYEDEYEDFEIEIDETYKEEIGYD